MSCNSIFMDPWQTFYKILLLLLLYNPALAQKENIYGHYTSTEFTLAEKLFHYINGTGLTSGTELTLNYDSTYTMLTCANIITGTWTVEADTLRLKACKNRWRNDSLHVHGFNGTWPKVSESTMNFTIKGEYLNHIYNRSFRSKSKTKLIKVNRT